MFFNSLEYFIFLPCVFAVYFVLKDKYRWAFLLIASFVFYFGLESRYLFFILGLITIVGYVFGLLLNYSNNEVYKKFIFWLGVIVNISILVYAKYINFIISNINIIASSPSNQIFKESSVLLTIGVSYYTFQSISYLIDIYIGVQIPEKHFGYYALYISFFPKLLQGPIERASDLLPQLKRKYEFNYENVRAGILLFFWGLFKKVVVADRIALYVNPVYENVHSFSGLSLVLATYLYAIQLYCDFSGYTDMALGSARIFNIKLTQNFNSPYFSTTIINFWRRWHISFSKWILDYIFTPLQFKFRTLKRAGTALALLITFFVSGLWHGSTWGFIIWGLLHGIYLTASIYFNSTKNIIYKKIGIKDTVIQSIWEPVYIFNIVCFSWIFFRASNVSDAIYIASHLFTPTRGLNEFLFSQGNISFIEVIVLIMLLLTLHFLKNCTECYNKFFERPVYFRFAVYYLLVMSIVIFNVDGDRAFLYFKF